MSQKREFLLLRFSLLLVTASFHASTSFVRNIAPSTARSKPRREHFVLEKTRSHEGTTANPTSNSTSYGSNYGRPLIPRDIFYDKTAADALEKIKNCNGTVTTEKGLKQKVMRKMKQNKGISEDEKNAFQELSSSGDWDKTTMTLVGYKGGPRSSQVNQDRSILIAPFLTSSPVNQNRKKILFRNPKRGKADKKIREKIALLGVLDGHGYTGEIVSEYARSEIPKRLAEKFRQALSKVENEADVLHNIPLIQQMIKESFVEVDAATPGAGDGGCTASIALQVGRKLFIANAGDSTTFVASYESEQQSKYQSKVYQRVAETAAATPARVKDVRVLFRTRENKPHVPEERARIEACGGIVTVPEHPNMDIASRVVYYKNGSEIGLATSRGIGDHDAPGVIADPVIDVLDIPQLLSSQASYTISLKRDEEGNNITDLENEMASKDRSVSNRHLLVVCATDGMSEYVHPTDIAKVMATSFHPKQVDNKYHPHVTAEQLVYVAAKGWTTDFGGMYRDDITISASKVEWDGNNGLDYDVSNSNPGPNDFNFDNI